MCDKIKLPILPPRKWSLGSWSGKFSPSCTSPAAFTQLMDSDYDILSEMLDFVEESHIHNVTEDRVNCFDDDIFGGTARADDCISVSDESTTSSDNTATNPGYTSMMFPLPSFVDATDNRQSAIARWKVKRGKQKGLTKVCKARSDVALGRPRVKGKFIKKAQFVSITELQGY